jgi:hypothetical protein
MTTSTKFWTKAEIVAKIERDLDLEGEVQITPTELDGYINAAIDKAEAIIHTLYEDYFLSKTPLTLVVGVDEYDLPSTIYAHKIRAVWYRNGTKIYEIPRSKPSRKIANYEFGRITTASDNYSYSIYNSTPGQPKFVLDQAATESGQYVTIHHIRQANNLVADTDVCDIPEFVHFVIQESKCSCYEKEGHPMLAKAIGDRDTMRTDMVNTLTNMIPDEDTKIEADFSFYEEHN